MKRNVLTQYLIITASCALYAVGFNWMFDPNHISVGGFTGLGQIINYLLPGLPIGTIVRPKQTTAELIGQYTRAMQNSMGSNVETLHQLGGAEALEFRVAAHHLTGVPLQDMPIRPDVLLCCINRKGRRIIPRGHDELQESDTVIVVSTRQGMNDLQDIFLPQEAQ